MPIYEYVCHECGITEEHYRLVAKRDDAASCDRGHEMQRIYSVPSLSIWDPNRSFPNVVRLGEGKFETRASYEAHLKSNHIAETKTDGRIYRPHGNKVVSRF